MSRKPENYWNEQYIEMGEELEIIIKSLNP